MNGGTISGNSASASSSNFDPYSYGGGVYVASGSFTMSGGTISGNSASASSWYSRSYSYGGGVYVASGSFTMSGGTISGNSASASAGNFPSDYPHYDSLAVSYGGGVCVGNSGIFTKTGGTITNTNILTAEYNTSGRVAYAENGSRHRETTAGPAVNLSSGSAVNWE
jgi:hypothetical protein